MKKKNREFKLALEDEWLIHRFYNLNSCERIIFNNLYFKYRFFNTTTRGRDAPFGYRMLMKLSND